MVCGSCESVTVDIYACFTPDMLLYTAEEEKIDPEQSSSTRQNKGKNASDDVAGSEPGLGLASRYAFGLAALHRRSLARSRRKHVFLWLSQGKAAEEGPFRREDHTRLVR